MNKREEMKTAADVRTEDGLPSDGRNALPGLTRIEAIFREITAPVGAVYDLQITRTVSDPVGWSYTEGLGLFQARTQCAEVNLHLALMAAAWDGPLDHDHQAVAVGMTDKWEPDRGAKFQHSAKVWFPPGDNLAAFVNHDNVLRAFSTDERWMLKPHPTVSRETVDEARRRFGVDRVYDPKASGVALLREAETVGFTTASELGLVAMALGKETVDFTMFEFETWGVYSELYRAIRENDRPAMETLNRIVNCPWSGYLPLDTPDDEARERLGAFREKASEMAAMLRPLTHQPPLPATEAR